MYCLQGGQSKTPTLHPMRLSLIDGLADEMRGCGRRPVLSALQALGYRVSRQFNL